MKLEPIVSTKSGIFAIVLCIALVPLIGTLFSTTYKSECSRDDAGKRTCTEHLEFLGWAGVPLQPIASAIGIGAGTFVAIARCKSPGKVVEYLARSKDNGDIPSQD